jgi:hypothetical protein
VTSTISSTKTPPRNIAAVSTLRHPDPAVEENYAARWRQKSLDQATAKAKRKAELVHGAAIRHFCTLDFADGTEAIPLFVEISEQRRRNRTYFRASNGGLYCIRIKFAYSVEAATV